MAKKEYTYRGRTLEELKKMPFSEFLLTIPARERRSLKRGYRDEEKRLVERINKGESDIQTHCRRIVILPQMIGSQVKVYDGKNFEPVNIEPDMVGHRLGEFAQTRKKVAHSAPGIGATKSSSHMSVK